MELFKTENVLHAELKRLELFEKSGLKLVKLWSYCLGINLMPAKRNNRFDKLILVSVITAALLVVVGLFRFIMANFVNSFTVYSESIVLTFQLLVGVIKIFYYKANRDKIQHMLHVTETGSLLYSLHIFEMALPNKSVMCQEIGEILLKSWQGINKQVRIFYISVCLPVSWYILRPYFQYIIDCYINKLATCEMTLTYPALMPYWVHGKHEYPSYLIRFYILQLGPIWCGATVFAFNSIFIVMSMHEVAVIRVLRYLVRNSTEDHRVPQHLRNDYIECCVKLYVRITKHHAAIEDVLKYIILVQCFVSCLLICMLLYKASMGLDLELAVLGMIIVYLVAILFEISLYNIDAQLVETESEELCFDWYNCNWYNESPKFKYIIKMMIVFGNRSFGLSVGGFTNMSHKLLLLVFRMSGNIFLLLRNVNTNN